MHRRRARPCFRANVPAHKEQRPLFDGCRRFLLSVPCPGSFPLVSSFLSCRSWGRSRGLVGRQNQNHSITNLDLAVDRRFLSHLV